MAQAKLLLQVPPQEKRTRYKPAPILVNFKPLGVEELSIQSRNDPRAWYFTDLAHQTCTCQGYAHRRNCVHLSDGGEIYKAAMDGVFSEKLYAAVRALSLPEFNDFMASFVKLHSHLNDGVVASPVGSEPEDFDPFAS